MGAANSKASEDVQQVDLPYDALIEHYYPPTFPIMPLITESTIEICRTAWETIKSANVRGLTGVVYFYDQFYARLGDKTKAFDPIWGGSMKKKGKVLTVAMEFVTTLDARNLEATCEKIRRLGDAHNRGAGGMQKIRPWMYSVYLETLVTTISFCLQQRATFIVMDSWVNLLGFVLKEMLAPAIDGRIDLTEASTEQQTARAVKALKTRDNGSLFSYQNKSGRISNKKSKPFSQQTSKAWKGTEDKNGAATRISPTLPPSSTIPEEQ